MSQKRTETNRSDGEGTRPRTRVRLACLLAAVIASVSSTTLLAPPAQACHGGGSPATICWYDAVSGCHVLWVEFQIHYDWIQTDGVDCIV
ncbi:MAG TPA: hypothetical protein VHN37_14145 [Actinomycetota bacterium]|nr:hypothetical protein [Actinomycetota bacterium]